MSTPLTSALNRALHSGAFAEALNEELQHVLQFLAPATPADRDLDDARVLAATWAPLTYTVGDAFAFTLAAAPR